jgi:hypothetical protein
MTVNREKRFFCEKTKVSASALAPLLKFQAVIVIRGGNYSQIGADSGDYLFWHLP